MDRRRAAPDGLVPMMGLRTTVHTSGPIRRFWNQRKCRNSFDNSELGTKSEAIGQTEETRRMSIFCEEMAPSRAVPWSSRVNPSCNPHPRGTDKFYMMAAYPKSERDDLSTEQRRRILAALESIKKPRS